MSATFTTALGVTHEFTAYNQHTNWNDVAGVYVFAVLGQNNTYTPLYVGLCDSFRTRIPQHERWVEAVRLGATTVLALVVPVAATRQALEREMIATLQPQMNTHHR